MIQKNFSQKNLSKKFYPKNLNKIIFSVIILSKLTEPKLKLNDVSNYGTAQLPMKEINVQLFLTWNDFSLFMSRSSTPNFIQGARKVAEFIQGTGGKFQYFISARHIQMYPAPHFRGLVKSHKPRK